MILLVGLGNIGDEYKKTRHNIGFRAVESFVQKFGDGAFKKSSKLQCEYTKIQTSEKEILVAKPHTLMNRSGISIGLLKSYFDIDPKNIWVVYDDIDIPLGSLRIRTEGSAGTHNGIKSIVEHIGKNFVRFRIGIGRENQPIGDLARFVLQPFSKKEDGVITPLIHHFVDAIHFATQEGVEKSMNMYNGSILESQE